MKQDVRHVKLVIDLGGQMIASLVGALKDGFQYSDLIQLMPVLTSVSQLVDSIKLVVPELQDLDRDEIALLCGSLFDAVKKVVDSVQSAK